MAAHHTVINVSKHNRTRSRRIDVLSAPPLVLPQAVQFNLPLLRC